VAPKTLETFASEVSEAARQAALVVVAGGDGTFNLAVNALSNRLDDLVLGLVPMGTGNDLARTLRIPRDPRVAARAVVEGAERAVDLCRARGGDVDRLFVNACMGGFPVEVNEAIDSDLKSKLGPFAFWVGGVRALKDITRYTVEMNDLRLEDVVAVGVGNGRTCGGGVEVWPGADPTDGRLEGCALSAAGVAQALELAAKVKGGRHTDRAGVETCSAARIEISGEPEIEFNLDGELVGLETPATFEVANKFTMRLGTPSG
jgi:diacylglycerol kinase (ATP)